jgi:nicotinamidase-related amidase
MKRNVNNNDLAIIVIDMQEEFLGTIYERERLIAAQQEVLRYAIREDVPVAVLEFIDCGPTIDKIKNKVRNVPRHAYIPKRGSSGFYETDLGTQLHAWVRRTLLLMGNYGSGCVYMTAMDGLDKGFTVVTHEKLIGCISYANREIAVAQYKIKGCLLTDYKKFLVM